MKTSKRLLFIALILSSKFGFSQANLKIGGQNLSSGDYVGPNNNEDLIVKTNGQTNTTFKKDGDLQIKNNLTVEGFIKGLKYLDVDSIHCRTIKIGNSWTMNDAGPTYFGTRAYDQQLQNASDRAHSFEGGPFGSPLATSRDNVKVVVGYLNSVNGPQHRFTVHSNFNNDVFSSFSNINSYAGILTANDGFKVGIKANGNAEINQMENLPMNFFTNNLQRATILANGRTGINTITPLNRLVITSAVPDPGAGNALTPGGSSGIRTTNMTAATPTVLGNGKVVSVNAAGDFILVQDGGGAGGSATAKNGLNTSVGAPDVELGGNLIRPTDVTMTPANDMVFNGDAQFGIGNTLAAGGLGPNSKVLVRADNTATSPFNRAFESQYVSATPIVANDQYAGYFSSDADGIGSGATTNGLYSNVLGNNARIFGFRAEVNSRANGGSGNGYGAYARSTGAVNNYGGFFEATTNGTGGTAYGIRSVANSDNVALGVWGTGEGPNVNYGGNFEVRNTAGFTGNINIGVRGLAENAGSSSNKPQDNIGVVGFSDNASNTNIGVAGFLNPFFSYSQLNIGLNTAVYGNGIPLFSGISNPWAGYFDGNVNVNGLYYQSGSVFTSDQMFKKNVDTITNARGIIKQLKPRTFYFDTTNIYGMKFSGKKQLGFIAQDVQTVLPELVGTTTKPATKDTLGNIVTPGVTYKTLNYNAFFALIMKGMQEQDKRIDSLISIIAASSSRSIAPITTTNTGNSMSNPDRNVTQTPVELSDKNVISLDNSIPNPWVDNTSINYNIPVSFGYAQIIFSTSDGRIIKTVDIKEKGAGTLNVYAKDLSGGLYTYSLIVDGKIIDTKKMVKQ